MTTHFGLKMIKNNRQKVLQKQDFSKLTGFAQQLRLAGLRPTSQTTAISDL
tara:strand:- start:1563 stop:1715 length:153 start_codon:yes stop_codon:yes gene_type:complete